MENKRILEDCILGAILLGGYGANVGQTMNFLTFKNFGTYTDFDNKTLFKCIAEMYPNETIDLVTVSAKMKQKYKISNACHIASLTAKISSNTNLINHCAFLLQIDLTEKFCKLLTDLSVNNILPIDERLMISSCATEIKEDGMDIFAMIPAFIKMATAKNWNNLVLTHAKNFNEQVTAKCSKIRHEQKKHAIFANFQTLCTTENSKKLFNQLKAEICR